MLVVQLKKTNYDTKIGELENKISDHNHDKYITAPEFNTLAASFFVARLAQANLITKKDFDTRLSSFNRTIIANKSKHLLVENKFKKLKTFDSSYLIGKSHFEEDGTQNYLVFQPMYRFIMNKHNQKPTYMFNKQDVTVCLTYIMIFLLVLVMVFTFIT